MGCSRRQIGGLLCHKMNSAVILIVQHDDRGGEGRRVSGVVATDTTLASGARRLLGA